jgi:hypothetical protein
LGCRQRRRRVFGDLVQLATFAAQKDLIMHSCSGFLFLLWHCDPIERFAKKLRLIKPSAGMLVPHQGKDSLQRLGVV